MFSPNDVLLVNWYLIKHVNMWLDCETDLVYTIINFQKHTFEIFDSVYLENAWSCSNAILHNLQSLMLDQLINSSKEWLVELSIVYFTRYVVNTASTPIGVEGGWWIPMEWWAAPSEKAEMAKKYHFKLPWAPDITNTAKFMLIPCQLSAHPDKMEPFINHQSTCGYQTVWRMKPQ